MKRSPLRRSKAPLKRSPLRARSRKRQKLYRDIRVPLVRKFMEEHPLCQRCFMARSTDPHEPLTRARGGSIVDPENLVALCAGCHRDIHLHPRQATEDGWLVRRSTPSPPES